MFGIECLPLVLFGLQETDVVEHPHEALFAGTKYLLILFSIVERLFRTLPHVKAARNGFTFGVELSVRINERKLLGAVQKLVICVLTVDFDKRVPKRLKLMNRCRQAIDPASRAAASVDRSPNDESPSGSISQSCF